MKKTLWIVVVLVVIITLVWWGQSRSKGVTGELRIGVISALTGQAAYYGQSTMKGAEIGKEKVREMYPNLSIELYHEDSMFTPKGGIDAYNKLKAAHSINALITMASNVSVGVQPVAAADNMLHIAASSLANGFSSPNDLSFRVTAKGDVEAKPAIDFIVARGHKKLGLIYMQNEIGVSLRDSLTREASGTGLEIIPEGYAVDQNDYRTILLKLKNRGIDSLYLGSLASHSASILKQAKELGLSVAFFSYRGAEDPALIANAPDLAGQILYTNSYDDASVDPRVKEFVDAYTVKWNEGTNGYAAEAYEAVILIADTYAKCGEDKECAKNYLSSIKNRPSVIGPVTFDEYGDVVYPFFIKTVRDGKFVRYSE